MKFNAFDFMYRASKSDVINLQSELKINNAYYPNIEMVWILRQSLRVKEYKRGNNYEIK